MSGSFSAMPNVRSNRWVRRNTSRPRYPSRTFDGTTPSASIKARHFVWSTIAKTCSIGSNVLFSSSRFIPTFSAILSCAFFRLVVFSILRLPETSATLVNNLASTWLTPAIFKVSSKSVSYTEWKQLTEPCDSHVYLSIP